QATTQIRAGGSWQWDQLMTYAQALLAGDDHMTAATLVTGMLANIDNVDARRKATGRQLVAQSYSRMGAVGLTIDENSEIAPLLHAALYLRLGDNWQAFETYTANRKLFDNRRDEVPLDLLMFVCESHIAAGGDENHERAEDILRGWIVKNSESKQFDDDVKARVQLLLAKNFAKARRYDLARSEYTTVINRYPDTAQTLEAEFGVGETFMAQKVYDQAELVFEELANRRQTDVIVRAEFLRGVLAYRRGDRDEARDIFRTVLERVPDIDLANQALFHLSEVYGDQERYIDQLNLLRTVGRLGRRSKRWHAPGVALSIVVQDSDLGISRGHNRIPVIVTTQPGGDSEQIYLVSGGAGKGLFRADLETQLGQVRQNDRVLQLSGTDVLRCDYPDEFKQEFRRVPLSDVDIHIAADAAFDVAGSKIVDEEDEGFSKRLERETAEEEEDLRVSQLRPADQIKPGNLIYMRVKDADRDLSDQGDQVVVKLTAESGDEVQVALIETGPHTGIFEGTARTGELPAGALATDAAIEHGPLMAIDRDPQTYWLSEPDGATPKTLTVDMKGLRRVSRLKISTLSAERNAPVRGEIYGSNDGRFWFRLASNPARPAAEPVAGGYGQMTRRVYSGSYTRLSNWTQVVAMSKNSRPIDEAQTNELSWTRPEGEEKTSRPYGVLWHGKLVQERDGAARIAVR
ncbi:MAG: tetratricopeptide repeat protein, partial [Planctomycetota bacterium]